MKKNKNQILFLTLASLLLVIIFNISTIWYVNNVFAEKSFSAFSSSQKDKLFFLLKHLPIQFILLVSMGFLQFSKTKTTLKIASSILLFLMICLIENTWNSFDKSLHLGLISFTFINIFPSVLIISITWIYHFYQQKILLETENKQLKSENAIAELHTLKEQLNPHFLFNSLNTLNSIIRTQEKEDSIEFVEYFSSIYRYILESEKYNLVTIQEEVFFLTNYFFLLKKRFSDGIVLQNDLTESVLQKKIPVLSLQLLLENVVKHNKINPKNPISVNIYNDSQWLYFRNNVQRKTNIDTLGLGLLNLNKRYQLLSKQTIIIEENTTVFLVKIPIL